MERWLVGVTCTRDRNQLYVTRPLRYYTQPYGRSSNHGYAQCSRFLGEGVMEHFVTALASTTRSSDEEAPFERATSARIRDGVRGLWGWPAAGQPFSALLCARVLASRTGAPCSIVLEGPPSGGPSSQPQPTPPPPDQSS